MIDKGEWSEKELEVLEMTAERKGWEWVEEHADHIINQARLVLGELD